jgi:hypothetical protein
LSGGGGENPNLSGYKQVICHAVPQENMAKLKYMKIIYK